MTTSRRSRRRTLRVAAALLVVPLIAACGVDTQDEPERIPAGVLPSELLSTEPAPATPGP